MEATTTLAQTSAGIFGVLNKDLVDTRAVELDAPCGHRPWPLRSRPSRCRARFRSISKGPEKPVVKIGAETGTTVGLEISDGTKSFFYVPGCAEINERVVTRLSGAELLFFDGTTFTDDEMVALGLSKKTAWRMGHVAMSGEKGSLERLAACGIGRKIYVHINNTNPVLIEDSTERVSVERAGWEVGFDGMEV